MATKFLKAPNGGIYKDSTGKPIVVVYESSAIVENPNPKFIKSPSGGIYKNSNGKVIRVAQQ